jgi:hypothetical protein
MTTEEEVDMHFTYRKGGFMKHSSRMQLSVLFVVYLQKMTSFGMYIIATVTRR